MQMAIFGKDPKQGCNWKIRVYLIDDSTKAFKVKKHTTIRKDDKSNYD